jgi:hypothetical protein
VSKAKKPAVKKSAAPKPKPVDPYHSEFDGTYTMKDYDNETNALKRWFDNFKIDRYATFANDYECLIVEEVPASAKHIKKKQICRIEHGDGTTREVKMDHTAPPAPIVFFAVKQRYVPPPPKSAVDLRKEEEYRRMREMGFSPRYRNVPIRKVSPSILMFDSAMDPLKMETTVEFVEEIEWVRDDRPRYYNVAPSSAPAAPPPAPRYRRN